MLLTTTWLHTTPLICQVGRPSALTVGGQSGGGGGGGGGSDLGKLSTISCGWLRCSLTGIEGIAVRAAPSKCKADKPLTVDRLRNVPRHIGPPWERSGGGNLSSDRRRIRIGRRSSRPIRCLILDVRMCPLRLVDGVNSFRVALVTTSPWRDADIEEQVADPNRSSVHARAR